MKGIWGQAGWIMLALGALSPCALGAPQMQGQIDAALGAGNAAQAEQLANAALTGTALAADDRSQLLVDRGMAREAQGRHEDALVDLTQAIESRALPAPDRARALFTRGAILDGQERLGDAIGDYGAALQLQPHFAAALNNRANVYRRQNHFADAERDYLASLASGNLQAEYSYFGLGQIAEAKGNTEGARGFYRQAVAANPNYGLAAERLAALGGGAGDGEAGIIHLHPPGTGQASTGILHLRPPRSPMADGSDTASVVLKRPQSAMPARASQIVQANYPGEKAEPGLRPALDATVKGAQVQLGAWRSEAEASQGWDSMLRRSGGLLNGKSPRILAVDLPGKGRYYRLRVGSGSDSAAKFCAALRAHGVDCLPARD